MPAESEIGIVGGGVLGMALAAGLTEAGHRVRIIEAAAQPGGLASPDSVGEYVWDRFYHVILMSDRHLLAWIDRLGLRDQLEWGDTRTGFWIDGRLVSLSSTLDYLRFPRLTLLDKARLAGTILRASRIRRPESLERVTAMAWLERWSGRRVAERLWRPLLESKLGPMADQASAAFIWAIIARLYAARRSGLKRERFGYVRGGYASILKQFRSHLERQGVVFQCEARVQEVAGKPGGATVLLEDGSSATFDQVVLTVPCPAIIRMCPSLSSSERNRLGRVVYQGIICPSVLLRRPLAGYYVTNLTDPSLPFTGVIEMTALVDPETFGGNTLVYLPRYVSQDDPMWSESDEAIVTSFLEGLRRLYPDLTPDDVVFQRVGRVRYVLPVSTLDYSSTTKPGIGTSMDTVFVVNSAQIAHGTLNVNETLALADAQLQELLDLIGQRSSQAIGAGR